jgi:hypothetical protein
VKRVWNSVERVSFSNIAATPAPFRLRGGSYAMTAHSAAWSAGSATLQRLAPDNLTYVTVLPAFSADGFGSANLPSGTYQLLVATVTALYVDIVGIATSE